MTLLRTFPILAFTLVLLSLAARAILLRNKMRHD